MKKTIYFMAFICAILLTVISTVYQADITQGLDGQNIGHGLPFSWLIASGSVFWGIPYHFSLNIIGLIGNIMIYTLFVMVLLLLHALRRGIIWTVKDQDRLLDFALPATILGIILIMGELVIHSISFDAFLRVSIVFGILIGSWATIRYFRKLLWEVE